MASYPTDYLYSEEHEWLRLEDGEAVVGITDFAQHELGEVVYVDLPEVGQSFNAGDEIGSIESVKAVAEVFTPVSGEIIAINEELIDGPEKVNEAPHDDGWLVRLRLASPEETGGLMSEEGYRSYIDEQAS